MLRFSVIIPTYNRAALLREAVESVFAQTFTDYEVIVVDDGSVDTTSAVVASYGDRVRVYRQGNSGPGAARNLGIQNAVGEYVAFLDSDDLWFPWTLASYQSAIEGCDKPGFICGECIKFSKVDEIKSAQSGELVCETFADYYAAWPQRIWIGTCGVAIRREALANTGGYIGGFINAEDSDLWMSLGIVPGFVHLKAPIVFAYRANPAGVSKTGAKTFEGMRQMVLREQAGKYPGGYARRRERWQILTWHLRPATMGRVHEGDISGAWWLYRKSFLWQIASRRFRYILALPVLILFYSLKTYFVKDSREVGTI
jgi:glycosyltransferase involved in cell wall biosynthesis